MSVKTKPWNANDYIDTQEMAEEYLKDSLEAVWETGDIRIFKQALRVVAETNRMSVMTDKTGSEKENQYRALTLNSNPRFDTLAEAVNSFGFKLTVEPV